LRYRESAGNQDHGEAQGIRTPMTSPDLETMRAMVPCYEV